MELGKVNKLIGQRMAPQGMYLTDAEGNEVLLPNSRLPKDPRTGIEYEAFVYRDSEERLIATLDKPLAQVGEITCLEVMDAAPFGYFLELGLDKQILLPMRELRDEPKVGDKVGVYLYVDKISERLVASARIDRYFNREIDSLNEGDGVEVLILKKDRVGYMVTFGDKYQGILYFNEVYQDLEPAQRIKAYIRKLRTDGKVDLILQAEGMDHVEPSAQGILDQLKASEGFIALHDKSDPKLIQQELQMSKKTFKKAIGTLYKKKLIKIEEDGIRLL